MTVKEILERIGLGEYCSAFEKNEFDREAFMNLEDKDFKELEIPPAPKEVIKKEIVKAFDRYFSLRKCFCHANIYGDIFVHPYLIIHLHAI